MGNSHKNEDKLEAVLLDHEEVVLLTTLAMLQHPAFQEPTMLHPLVDVAVGIRGKMSHANVARLCLKLSLAHARFHKDEEGSEEAMVDMTDILSNIIKVDESVTDETESGEDWKH